MLRVHMLTRALLGFFSDVRYQVSQLVDEIGTKFQRLTVLTPYFWGPASQWQQPECCPTKPEVGSPRWRPLNRKYLDLSLQLGQERNANGYTLVFGVQELNGSSLNAVRHKPEVENPRWRLLNQKSTSKHVHDIINSEGQLHILGSSFELSNGAMANIAGCNRMS